MIKVVRKLGSYLTGGRINSRELIIIKYIFLVLGIIVAISWTQFASPFRHSSLLETVYAKCYDGPSYLEPACWDVISKNPSFLLYKLGDNIHAVLIGLLIFYYVVFLLRRLNDTKYAGKYHKFIWDNASATFPFSFLNDISIEPTLNKANKYGPVPKGFSWSRLRPIIRPKKL